MNIKSDIYLLTVDMQKCVQGETRIKITHIIMKHISPWDLINLTKIHTQK